MVLVTKTKKRKPRVEPRQHGHHHKRNDRYLHTYWPYIPLILIAILGLSFSNVWGVIQKNVLGYAVDTTVSGLLQSTNDQRTANGVAGLTINDKLMAAAQAKANDMAARDYWSHNTPEGNPPWVFFSNAGYNYVNAGENLAYGFDTSGATITGWMNSPPHKENLLNSSFVDVGFGIANNPNYQGTGPETIVVAEYGKPAAAAAAPAPAPTATKPSTPPPAAAALQPTTSPDTVPAAPAEAPKETNATAVADSKQEPQVVGTRNVSRIQVIANGSAPWSMFAVSAIATISIAIFFLRHGLLLHRVFVRGETFIHHHPFLDIALVSLATVGFILTRSAGIIR